MQFLAHRGLWRQPSERNTRAALNAAIAGGFGLETDVRDRDRELVIAHDPADGSAQPLLELLECAEKSAHTATLALNIKSDGLRAALKTALVAHRVERYFCFDMSVPETLAYRREGLRFFTRESEYEPVPAFYTDAAGVWMDMFHTDWISPPHLTRHLDAGKEIALVSPELHGRPHLNFWETLRTAGLGRVSGLMLCTDHPAEARDFFHA